MRETNQRQAEYQNEVLKRLITFRHQDDTSEESCCICLQTYEEGDELSMIPICGHKMHSQCLKQWFDVKLEEYSSSSEVFPLECVLCKRVLLLETLDESLRN